MDTISTTENAIVIVKQSAFSDKLYGGETLVGRALIALTKSEIKNVVILCEPGYKKIIDGQISEINPNRISISFQVRERTKSLDIEIKEILKLWNQRTLIFEASAIVHPSLLTQMKGISRFSLYVYGGVTFQNDHFAFKPDFKEKYKVIFQEKEAFHFVGETDGFLNATGQLISCDILNVNDQDLKGVLSFDSVRQLIDNLSGKLRIQFLEGGWWLPVFEGSSIQWINAFFWKLAFKEISGEFSKTVNSKISRPVSLWLAKKQVAPNSVSATQIILFVASSCLLLMDSYTAMIVFAVMWQFSAGVLDRCDGETARIRNYESESGARFDMIVDDLRFYLPFVVLGFTLGILHDKNTYAWVLVGLLLWGLSITFYQQLWMRRTGYVSLQVMNQDYLNVIESGKARLLRKWQPIFKGDIRTFYVTVLSVATGSKEVIFWVLATYIFFVGVGGLVGVRRLSKLGKLEKITMPS